MSNLYFVIGGAVFLTLLIVALVVYSLRARKRRDTTWDDLLQRLTRIDRDAIATIARDAEDDSSGDSASPGGNFELGSDEIWQLLGGLEGLETLENNCRVLVDIATYVQRYYPEALVVAEQLRLNAREIEWHVGRLKGAAQTGNLQASFADYAQRAVVTYTHMTRLVLELCDHVSLPGAAALHQAI